MITKAITLILIFAYATKPTFAKDKNPEIKTRFQWRQVDFNYPNDAVRQSQLESGDFVPSNNFPNGLAIWKGRLFVTVPRWKLGIPSSLNFVCLNDTNESPRLNPFPNWDAHRFTNNGPPEIVTPFHIEVDRCGRLWVLDSGINNLLSPDAEYYPPKLLIYNLENDRLIRKFVFPAALVEKVSFYANIALEDDSCDDSWGYFGDLGNSKVLVYSLKQNKIHLIDHLYFHPEPLHGDFTVKGLNYQWSDGIFGMTVKSNGQSPALYFHSMAGIHEYNVSTQVLKENGGLPFLSSDVYHQFNVLGNRGDLGQSSAEHIDPKTGVMFYSLIQKNAIACWNSNRPYKKENQRVVLQDPAVIDFISDVKVDHDGNLWTISNTLPFFMFASINPGEVNFRVFTGKADNVARAAGCL